MDGDFQEDRLDIPTLSLDFDLNLKVVGAACCLQTRCLADESNRKAPTGAQTQESPMFHAPAEKRETEMMDIGQAVDLSSRSRWAGRSTVSGCSGCLLPPLRLTLPVSCTVCLSKEMFVSRIDLIGQRRFGVQTVRRIDVGLLGFGVSVLLPLPYCSNVSFRMLSR